MKHKKQTVRHFSILIFFATLMIGLLMSFLIFSKIYYHQINLVVFSFFGFLFAYKQHHLHLKAKKMASMLNFVDQFIITLSIHKTILATMNSVEELSEANIKSELKSFTENEPLEKLDYLGHYFGHPIFNAFLDIVHTYLEQGGDILKSSSALLKEVAETRANRISIKQLHERKLAELIVGWCFVLMIIVMLRFVISDIYQSLLDNPIFTYGLQAFLVLILMSFVGYFRIVMATEKRKSRKMKKTDKWIPVHEFVQTFSLFRMNLTGTGNVYKTLERTANFSHGTMNVYLYELVGQLKNSTSINPFISLASHFKEPLVKHILINIYQLMINGGDSAMLFEFNYLFDRLYELNSVALYEEVKRKHETLAQLPMLGSGLLVMLIMVGVIGLLGSVMYV